jgi:tRNA threonylcarbamoyladenosine dehydratase
MNNINFQSHRTQLVLTALTASLATAGLLSLYSTYSRLEKRRSLDRDVQRSISALDEEDALKANVADKANNTTQPLEETSTDGTEYGVQTEELIREQLARNYTFFGAEGMKKIRRATVVVVGCGGVGSWAAVMLVRS